ncbi:MAG TPA: xanthine dehydrogenase family protein subunit M [Gemmatimonadaceae bacterium]|nr:xanthine dehydrogenase family protein subunit M [Gemmatimonadaceae bacterium]
MYPAPFEYHAPESVQEAIGLLSRYEDDAKLLAGGHSLLPVLKLRFAQPKHLIDVRRIPGLSGIREEGDALVIGATTAHAVVEADPRVRRRVPVLSEAAGQIGDFQVRNMGTIGGSLAHADPAADYPAAMLALGAEVCVAGPTGPRSIGIDGFFTGLLETALRPGEIITEVRIPLPPARTGSAYAKLPHPASRYAVVGVAAVITADGAGKVTAARIGVTGIGPHAFRAGAAERALIGTSPDAPSIAAAVAGVAGGLELRDDGVGPAAYRIGLARTFAARAVEAAVARARG